jgi:hypothetical protein
MPATLIGPSQGRRDKKKLIGQKKFGFPLITKLEKKNTHTPFREKRYQEEQPPSKGHKRVPKVTAGIEYSAVNSKRVQAYPIAAATPK